MSCPRCHSNMFIPMTDSRTGEEYLECSICGFEKTVKPGVSIRHDSNRDMAQIFECVICGKDLSVPRQHVDTCGERCFQELLKQQRARFKEGDMT